MMKKENQKNNAETEIKPLGDRILIKELLDNKEKKTASGIIIPITVNSNKESKIGTVISVGVGRYEDGKLIPISVKKGDKVLFQWGEKIVVESEEYYIVRESEVLAIID